MPNLIGSDSNQVPTNGMLGTAAFIDAPQLPVSTSTQAALDAKVGTTGPQTIAANSTSPALTITQDGTGNALEVRDVSGDATPFVIGNGGAVTVGHTANPLIPGVGTNFAVVGTDNTSAAMGVSRHSADNDKPRFGFFKSRGAIGSQGLVSSGDSSGQILFASSDGSGHVQLAQIEAFVDGTPGTNDMPGRLVFSTTADGASSPTERVRIDSSGNVGIGSAPSGYRVDILPSSTGAALRVRGGSGASSTVQFTDNAESAQWASISTTATSLLFDHAAILRLGTGGSERLRIDSAGNVGIGTSSPAHKLQVSGNFGLTGVGQNTTDARVITLNSITDPVDTARAQIVFGTTAGGSSSSGYLSFSTANYGVSFAERLRIDSSGLTTIRNSTGLGYGAGSGGTVTQATSKSTAVTLNKPSGQITMHNAALAAGASVSFTVNASGVVNTDTVTVGFVWSFDPSNYAISVPAVGTAAFQVRVTNISGVSHSEALVIAFNVHKGSAS